MMKNVLFGYFIAPKVNRYFYLTKAGHRNCEMSLKRLYCSCAEKRKNNFFNAAKNGNIQELENIDKNEVDMKDDEGWTLLMHGCKQGHLTVVKHLIKHQCQVSAMNRTGQTAKDIAFFWKNKDIASFLVSNENSQQQLNNNSIFFTQNPLVRHSEIRNNETWLYSVIQNLNTKFILMFKSQPVVIQDKGTLKSRNKLLQCSIVQTHEMLKNEGQNLIFLGMFPNVKTETGEQCEVEKEVPWFALDISHIDIKELKSIDESATYISVYPGVFQLSSIEAAIVGQARALTDWHFRYKFCPSCGSDTFLTDSGYKRICKDPTCLSHTGLYNTNYPRVDPSVITTVLTPDDKYCLLGRKKTFPTGMYTCLAGFIEPGESIENACRREVKEEVGVNVNQVDYIGSQPWPMPSQLMIGMQAYADSKAKITLDDKELEEAQWFSRQEVVEMLTHQSTKQMFVPPKQALAHHLIKSWVLRTA